MSGRFFIRTVCLLSFVGATLMFAGCGRPVGTVKGNVTYNGKALKGGNVTFISSDEGQSFSTSIGEDGTYSIPNIKGGAYKVCVETESLRGAQGENSSPYGGTNMMIPRGAKTAPPPGAAIPEGYTPSDPAAMASFAASKRYIKIPDKYATSETTDLTFEFKGGDDTYNIDLK